VNGVTSLAPVRRAVLSLVVVCTTWGTIPLLTRGVDLAPAAIVFVRAWAGAAALTVAERLRHPRPGRHRGRPAVPRRAFLVGPLLALHWTAMFAGYQHAPADVVVFVVFLAPIGIAVVAPRALGERVNAPTIAALAVAVAGFVLITGPALDGARARGVAAAALSALTLVVLVVVSKPLAESLGGARLSRLELTGAGITLLPVLVLADWSGPTARQWVGLAVLGVVHTGIAVAVYLEALAKVPATSVAIVGYLEPVAVVGFAWLVLADAPSATTVAGGALIVLAGALVLRSTSADAVLPEAPVHVPR
jgi:drug/metabolite transporter (DMT)-like permease